MEDKCNELVWLPWEAPKCSRRAKVMDEMHARATDALAARHPLPQTDAVLPGNKIAFSFENINAMRYDVSSAGLSWCPMQATGPRDHSASPVDARPEDISPMIALSRGPLGEGRGARAYNTGSRRLRRRVRRGLRREDEVSKDVAQSDGRRGRSLPDRGSR
ncbi:hypothetical protein PsYK624_137160 [Phanerochaete sordida]|uniref:Uncharacterized protein n=1 Tax=Phanerochaete sordida TaxID=48140 RepID=A0A9P3LJL4_9APHY|nr:hypothetical protein PsYK624_137160 [Phanerochaete sordida]